MDILLEPQFAWVWAILCIVIASFFFIKDEDKRRTEQ